MAPATLDATQQELKYVPSIGHRGWILVGRFHRRTSGPLMRTASFTIPRRLRRDTAILGWPRVILQASASAPLADWFARLSDVAPDGTVTMITGAGQERRRK